MSFHFTPLLAATVEQQSGGPLVLTADTVAFTLSIQPINEAAVVLTADTVAFSLAIQPINQTVVATLVAEPVKYNLAVRSANQPLAAGPNVKIVTLGDSIMEYADLHGNVPPRVDNQSDGEIHWVKARGKAGYRHENWYAADAYWYTPASVPLFKGANQGRAGDWATGVKRRLTAVFNMNPDIVVLCIGTNNGPDADGNANAVTCISEIASVLTTLTTTPRPDGGGFIKVALGCIRPRVVTAGATGTYSYEITPATRARAETINTFIRAQDNDSTIFVWDSEPDLLDPEPVAPLLAGSIYRWGTRDGVHLAPRGAAASSRSLELCIDRILADGTWFDSDPTVSNAITNGALTGTAGVVGAGVTGQAPDSCSIVNLSGASAIISAVSSTTAGAWKVAVSSVGGGSSSSNTQVLQLKTSNVSVAGQGWTSTTWVKIFAEVEVSNGENVGLVTLNLIEGSSTLRAQGLGAVASDRATQPDPSLARSGWIETYPLQCGAATTLAARLEIEPRIDLAGNFTVTVKKLIMREVEDPRITFPYDPTAPTAFALAIQDATITATGSPVLVADTVAYTSTIQDVNFIVSVGSVTLTADPVAFALAIQQVTITIPPLLFSAGAITLALVIQDVTFTLAGTAPVPVNIPTLLKTTGVLGKRRARAFIQSNQGVRS